MHVLSLYYPVAPHHVNRPWGLEDERYLRFGFTRHNGIDLALSLGQSVCAPFPCRVAKVGDQPEGSGIYVSLISTTPYDFPDGVSSLVEITLMHLLITIVEEGMVLAPGELLGLGGTSGFSTGPHTHLAAKRVHRVGTSYQALDENDAGNTFDPTLYWNTLYAEDLTTDDEVTLVRLQRALVRITNSPSQRTIDTKKV